MNHFHIRLHVFVWHRFVMLPSLTLSLQRSSCSCFSNARITGMCHHTWLQYGFLVTMEKMAEDAGGEMSLTMRGEPACLGRFGYFCFYLSLSKEQDVLRAVLPGAEDRFQIGIYPVELPQAWQPPKACWSSGRTHHLQNRVVFTLRKGYRLGATVGESLAGAYLISWETHKRTCLLLYFSLSLPHSSPTPSAPLPPISPSWAITLQPSYLSFTSLEFPGYTTTLGTRLQTCWNNNMKSKKVVWFDSHEK